MAGWRGRSYHIESGSLADPDRRHLFIVLTEPNQDDEVLAVSLTSTIDTDKTCIVAIGEHPFVTKESYAAYRYLEIIKTPFLDQLAEDEDAEVSDALLARICDGLAVSIFVEPKFLKFFLAQTE